MELEMRRETVQDTAELFVAQSISEESGELVVPDRMPDMVRIVDSDVHMELRSKELRGGKVYAEAVSHVTTLYVPENGTGLCSLTLHITHNTVFDVGGTTTEAYAPVLSLRAECAGVTVREMNPRKLSAKVACRFCCSITETQDLELCSGAEAQNVEMRLAKKQVHLITGVYEKTLSVSDSAELASAGRDVGEIMKYSLSPRAIDCRPITNKLILKGEIGVHLLAAAANESGRVITLESTVPFAGVIECEGIGEESNVDLRFDMGETTLSVITETGTNRPVLALKTNLLIGITAWEDREVSYLADAYAVGGTLHTETETVSFRRAEKSLTVSMPMRETLPVGVTIQSVYTCNVTAEKGSCRVTEEGLSADATCTARLIVESEEGGVYAINKSIPCDGTAVGVSDLAYQIEQVTIRDTSYHISGTEDIELRFTAEFTLLPEGKTEVTYIRSMEWEESDCDGQRRPALTICRCEENESFWMLGKRLGASVSAIQNANHLTGEYPPAGKLVLVPRK